MTYKDSNPTFNTGNRKVVNYKDFIQHEPQEEAELKKMKRQFKKADQVKAVNQDHQSKYNKVTHKNDDLVKAEIEDKLDALEEGSYYDDHGIREEVISTHIVTYEDDEQDLNYLLVKTKSGKEFKVRVSDCSFDLLDEGIFSDRYKNDDFENPSFHKKTEWTRNEVIELLKKHADDIDDLYRPYTKDNSQGFHNLEEWIKNNL